MADRGVTRAAILMIALGTDRASAVLRLLKPDETEMVTAAVSRISEVDARQVESVLAEADTMLEARRQLLAGGVDYARNLLQKAFGSQQAEEMLRRLREALIEHPFTFARSLDAGQIWPHIRQESPQTIALVVAHLSSEQASSLLQMFPAEVQGDVAWRLANIGRDRRAVRPEAIEEVANLVKSRVVATQQQDAAVVGGVDAVAAVITRMPRSAEQAILERIRSSDTALAEEIGEKLFTFDDLAALPQLSLQLVLSEISDAEEIAIALKTATTDIKNAMYRSMSKDKRESVEESLELMDKLPLRKVEEAQLKMVAIARRLEAEGRISLGRGEAEELV